MRLKKFKKYWTIPFSIIVGILINILINSPLLLNIQGYDPRTVQPTSIVEFGFNFILYPFYILFFIYFIKSLIKKNFKKSFIYLLPVILVWMFLQFLGTFFGVKLPAITEDHFRTNRLTGECDYGGMAGYVEDDPWYYRPDCELEQKIEIAKERGFYKSRLESCEKYCRSDWDYFCGVISEGDAYGNGPENLECVEIYDCNRVNCTEYLQARRERLYK